MSSSSGGGGGAPDFYAVLGVSPDASEAEIRAAYRRAAFESHPDTAGGGGGGQQGARRFHLVQEAWGVLRDAGRRAQYDRMRALGWGGAPEDWEAGESGLLYEG